MADAKKCDRCGKLFEPYNIDDGCKVPSRYTNILLKNISLVKGAYKEFGEYDLCKECSDSLLKWLLKPRIVKCECSNECDEATKKKKETKQKGCNAFGEFDGSIDCLMCPKCDECKVVTEIMNSWCFGNSYGKLNNQCRNCICKKECKTSFDRKRFKGAKNK